VSYVRSVRTPTVTPGFQHYVAVSVTVSVPAFLYAVAGACSAAIAQQSQEAGRRVSSAKEWVELQATGATAKWKNRTRSYMNGSTATANLQKWRMLFFT